MKESRKPIRSAADGQIAFGKYAVVKTIESGSMAELHKARDREKGRIVLLRVLARSASENPEIRKLFADLHAERSRLFFEDAYVLKVLELGRCQGRFYLAFEYLEGVSLVDFLKKERPGIEDALSIVRQAAEGLRAFHQRRLVHGDVKPANIIVGRDSANRVRVKLAPMDIATAASDSMVSIYGELMGTPKYLSPE
ncbi:unnamed protein product, partial [marine sediment metagenome]